MKQVIIITVACCWLMLSCKKPTPEKVWRGMFGAVVDSDSISFAVDLKVKLYHSSISGKYHLLISAYDKMGGDQLEILASDTTDITRGRYCEDGSTGTRIARLSIDERGQHYPYMSVNGSGSPATITISVLQEDRVQGKFSGEVRLLDYIPPNLVATSVKKQITNGTFDLTLQ